MTERPGARSDILAAIRRAAPGSVINREADYASVARNYVGEGRLDTSGRLALFADRLEHYDVGVHRTTPDLLPAAIATACVGRRKNRLVIPTGFPAAALPREIEFAPDLDLSYDDLDRCDGVVTMSTLGIAVTGTIVLTHTEEEGRRAVTLIPDYHLCVVPADRIVETVPEAFRRLSALQPPLITTISGPSATADIEMIRVRGVHGPRTLDVIVVG
jgi:L-lactate dehydrogenase complex protein LldG